MSRIGKKPISVPKGVEIKIDGRSVRVKGPKGVLERELHHSVKVSLEGDTLAVDLAHDTKMNKRFHGLSRTLVANMVEGVSNGFTRSLTLVGVGYRAAQNGTGLTLSLGYSHPIEFDAPEGVELKALKPTELTVSGANKELVGQVAAKIRSFRPPEPYHGKGVRYSDERIVTKVGKTSGKK